MAGKQIRPYLDWTFSQFWHNTPPKCNHCKRPIGFGRLCLFRRLYNEIFGMWCDLCAIGVLKNEPTQREARS
jgi:hypothetical protein